VIGLLAGHSDTVLLLEREVVVFVLGRLGKVAPRSVVSSISYSVGQRETGY
jgi:hypothetical protein